MSLALLPRLKGKRLLLYCILGIALSLYTTIAASKIFRETDKKIIQVEKAFASFPKNLRLAYLGDPALPYELHRCFDYYHLRYGGMGPYHLFGKERSVNYKSPLPPRRRIYDYGPEAIGSWLNAYNAVLIISGPNVSTTKAMIEKLLYLGYRQHSKPPIALFFNPQYMP
jgi:hypothetical protein